MFRVSNLLTDKQKQPILKKKNSLCVLSNSVITWDEHVHVCIHLHVHVHVFNYFMYTLNNSLKKLINILKKCCICYFASGLLCCMLYSCALIITDVGLQSGLSRTQDWAWVPIFQDSDSDSDLKDSVWDLDSSIEDSLVTQWKIRLRPAKYFFSFCTLFSWIFLLHGIFIKLRNSHTEPQAPLDWTASN